MKLRLGLIVIVALAAARLIHSSTLADNNPGNQYERFKFPWVDDGSSQSVSQSVDEGTHTGTIRYAVDFQLPYNTYVAAAGQGQVTDWATDPNSTTGFGMYILQAVSTSGAGTKYILYAHLCSIGAATLGGTLYQGEYVGRSGNTGYVLPPPAGRCAPGYSGMHLHFQFDNTSPPSNSWQWTAANGNAVSLHSATQASLGDGHSSQSNNTPPGAYPNLTTDSFIHDSYVSRSGLNYGSTKALDPSQYTPCGASTRWVHACSLGTWGGGIAQTWESPEGYQRALIRRSNYTGVYSVQRSVLYAFHLWTNTLGYPTADESGANPVTQYFNGGRITKTTVPCQTNVYNSGGQLLANYYVCN